MHAIIHECRTHIRVYLDITTKLRDYAFSWDGHLFSEKVYKERSSEEKSHSEFRTKSAYRLKTRTIRTGIVFKYIMLYFEING